MIALFLFVGHGRVNISQLQARFSRFFKMYVFRTLSAEMRSVIRKSIFKSIHARTMLIFVRGSVSVGDYAKIPCYHNYYTLEDLLSTSKSLNECCNQIYPNCT